MGQRLYTRLVVDEDVLGINALRLLDQRALLGITQDELHLDRSLGEGDAQHLFVGAAFRLSQWCLSPLEVERIEREGVDQSATRLIVDVELSIATQH